MIKLLRKILLFPLFIVINITVFLVHVFTYWFLEEYSIEFNNNILSVDYVYNNILPNFKDIYLNIGGLDRR